MIIPVRCFTCGKVIGNKWQKYLDMVEKDHVSKKEALDDLGCNRYCCRRMYIGHIDLLEDVATYSAARHR